MSRLLCVLLVLLVPSLAAAQDSSIQFTALAAGDRFTCGLTADGRAYCWGTDKFGQLGIGGATETCDRSLYEPIPCARTPLPVAGDHRFTAIAAGADHACALTTDGAVFCWGGNLSKQLGVADVPDDCSYRTGERPQDILRIPCSRRPVRAAFDRPAVALAVGDAFTCALDGEGQAWCWGSQGRTAQIAPVNTDVPLATLAAGGYDACGITTEGALLCWDVRGVYARARFETPALETGWRSVTVSVDHACALDAASAPHCWGSDADGALGRGRTAHDRIAKLPLARVLGNLTLDHLATGTLRTCGIDTVGRLYCWGRVGEADGDSRCLNSNGVAETNECTTRPVAVQPRRRFRAISIGWSHQCGLTLEGEAICWGRNDSGELGDGSLRTSETAAAVRTGGISVTHRRFLDTRDSLAWLWSWRGGLLLVAVIGAVLLVRPLRAWWQARPPAGAAATGADWLGRLSIVVVLAGWAFAGLMFALVATSEGRGDVAYGLANFALMLGVGAAVLAAVLALIMAVMAWRNRGSAAAVIGFVLASLTLVSAALASLWLYIDVR